MTTELTNAAQQALERLKLHQGSAYCNACEPEDEDAIIALERALTQRPAAQTEREADGYGSTDLPWSFTVCRELEPQEKRLMSMLVSAFGSDHPAIDDMAHLILNRPASLPAPQQATPAQPSHTPICGKCKVDRLRAPCPNLSNCGMGFVAQGDNLLMKRAEREALSPSALQLLVQAAQRATPEPVGEPAAWRWFNSNGDQVSNWLDFKAAQKANVEERVAEAGGRIEYAYTRPAAAPAAIREHLEGVARRSCTDEQFTAFKWIIDTTFESLDLLAAAQAKGGQP